PVPCPSLRPVVADGNCRSVGGGDLRGAGLRAAADPGRRPGRRRLRQRRPTRPPARPRPARPRLLGSRPDPREITCPLIPLATYRERPGPSPCASPIPPPRRRAPSPDNPRPAARQGDSPTMRIPLPMHAVAVALLFGPAGLLPAARSESPPVIRSAQSGPW